MLAVLAMTEPGPDALLAGPRVVDAGDDSDLSFGGRRRRSPAMPAREWFRALSRLDVTADQQAQIDRVRRELIETRQAFQASRDKQPEEPRDAAKRPDVRTYQNRLWLVLDERQREQLRAALSEVRSGREAADIQRRRIEFLRSRVSRTDR
jgi:hypothetical protein